MNRTLLGNEFKLLIRSSLAWVFMALTAVFAAMGMNAINNSNEMSLHGIRSTSLTMSLGSARYGALAGAAMFAMLTLIVLSRDERKKSRSILEAGQDYFSITMARIAGLMIIGIISVALVMGATFIIQKFIMGISYDFRVYAFSYGFIMLPSILFSVLICSGLYMVFESMDVSFLIFGVLFFAGFTSSNYLLSWVQTTAPVYSDFGGIGPLIGLITYNRLLWVFLCAAILLLGMMMRRRYGFGAGKSMMINTGKGIVPGLLITSMLVSGFLYAKEPYIFSDDSIFNHEIEPNEAMSLVRIFPHVVLNTDEGSMSAEVIYEFKKGEDEQTIEFITNAGLEIDSLKVNGAPAAVSPVEGTDRISVSLPAGNEAHIEFEYHGALKYPAPGGFPGYITGKSVYLLEGSHWIFQPLVESRGIIDVRGSVSAPEGMTVVTPGRIMGTQVKDGIMAWNYEARCSNAQLAVFASDYRMKTIQAGGADVEFYYAPGHEEYIDSMNIEDYIKSIMEFYQDKLGPYPFEEYPLKIVETPIYKTGGHSTLNIVTVAEYIFNRENRDVPSGKDMLFLHDVNILAHEIAHQWFDTGVSVVEEDEWSSEGLVEYISYKYLETSFNPGITASVPGAWHYDVERHKESYYTRNRDAIKGLRGEMLRSVIEENKKVMVYSLMPLKLMKAEEIKGEDEFLKGLSYIYIKYLFKSLTYDAFLKEIGLGKEEIGIE